MASEDDVDTSLRRLFGNRFRVGQFDPNTPQQYTEIGQDQINTTESWEAVLDQALQGLVLLQNNGVLPLQESSDSVLAVVGPHAFTQRDLFEVQAARENFVIDDIHLLNKNTNSSSLQTNSYYILFFFINFVLCCASCFSTYTFLL